MMCVGRELMGNQVVLFGSSGYGLGFAMRLRTGIGAPECETVAMIDEMRGHEGGSVGGIPVIGFNQWRSRYLGVPCLITVGSPSARRLVAQRLAEAGGRFIDLYPIDERYDIRIGRGSLVHDTAHISPCVALGEHVHVMPGAVVGHDVRAGDYVTVCTSAVISGHVVIEDGAFIGAGSVISNGTRERPIVIGRDAIVGVGSVVTKSVAPGVAVMGNPARPLRELVRGSG